VVNEELVVATGNDVHVCVADCQNIESCHEMGGPGVCDSRGLVLAKFPRFGWINGGWRIYFFAKVPPSRLVPVIFKI
ncbi:hypothetical protein ACCT02_37635, partial [Rhizobium ruizarguesonis]